MEDETRTCNRCAEVKPLEAFPRVRKGEDRRQAYCCACKAVMQKSWYERNKARHIANVKEHTRRYYAECRRIIQAAKDVPCADCGERFPSYVMDFDHVRGRKVGNISHLAGQRASPRLIKAEIAKCDVVCANCHRDRTHRRRLQRSS